MAAVTHALAITILCTQLQLALGDGPGIDLQSEHRSTSIAGCMTTACHGSNVAESKNWQRAGKIWFDQDPHARAYTNLLTDSSAKIVSRLINKEVGFADQAYLDVLNEKCVSCHSNEHSAQSQRALGVDCQACHGNADAWGSQHYSSEWKALGAKRFEGTQMLNVESISLRTKVCASCHVGELNRIDTEGRTVGRDREVDHRLMAAGHPPMYFDFESYFRRYPVHWELQDEPIGLNSTLGMQRWRTGKIVTTIARLDLLAARAERAAEATSNASDWPELTEYSCNSCHHSIGQASPRQSLASDYPAAWDDWTVLQLDCAVREQSTNDLSSQLIALKKVVEKQKPDPKQVADSARTLRRWLGMELEQVSAAGENSAAVLLPKLKSRLDNVQNIQSWEAATQWYFATRVLSEGIGVMGLREPASFISDDPFASDSKTWTPASNYEMAIPRIFRSDMLKTYSNDLKQQLRTRP